MSETVLIYLPWVITSIAIWAAWQTGNKYKHVWAVKLFNQSLWLVWIILSGTWGFLPQAIVNFVVFYRNHLKWSVEDSDA